MPSIDTPAEPRTTAGLDPVPIATPNMDADQPASSNVTLSINDAKVAALKHAGAAQNQAVFVKEATDEDDGAVVYELEFVANDRFYETEVNANSGAVVDSSWRPVESIPTDLPTGVITVDQAKDAATKDANITSPTYSKVELDMDDGRYQYDIEFVKDGTVYDYELNAETGEVIERSSERVNR